MKTLLITRKNQNVIEEFTIERIESYAKKTQSDFLIIENDEDSLGHFWAIPDLLRKYDRILYISSFILIRSDTPNLFDIVPDDKLGMFNEGRYADRNLHMNSAISYYKEDLVKDWEGKYYSSDVMLVSKRNRSLFMKSREEYGTNFDPYINLKIHNSETSVFALPYKYNRMEYLDAQIGISRLDSYMINYTDAPTEMIRGIVEKDIAQWDSDAPKYEYKQNILIRLSAGLGDQICSEPVARYVRKMYPEANIYLTTHHPRIFRHLEKHGIKVHDYTTWKGINDALLVMENNPSMAKSKSVLTQVLFHATDYSSISMIRRTIPHDEKRIHIDVDVNEVRSVMELTKDRNKDKKTIIVNAGKWWPSKTFPESWWQKVVDLLSEKLCVILIGVTLSEKQGYLPIKCPADGLDFRDFTTLGEYIAMVSLSKVTLTNDSSPVHIAGAFDNWIVLIPTCKHPDQTLPYRYGSQQYKTKVLCKKLLWDDLELRHTEFYFDTIDKIPQGKIIEEYLPEPEEVVNQIFDIYSNEN